MLSIFDELKEPYNEKSFKKIKRLKSLLKAECIQNPCEHIRAFRALEHIELFCEYT